MDSVTRSLASVVTDIELNRDLTRTRIYPVRIVTHTHRLHDSVLQRLFFARPSSKRVGKVTEWLTRDNRLAMAHRLQQYERTKQYGGCDPPSDRSLAPKHELRLSAPFQPVAESNGKQKAGEEKPEKSPNQRIRAGISLSPPGRSDEPSYQLP